MVAAKRHPGDKMGLEDIESIMNITQTNFYVLRNVESKLGFLFLFFFFSQQDL